MHDAETTESPLGRLRRLLAGPVKPRVVLGLLLAGSFAGVWVSNPGDPASVRAVWWLTIVTAGALAGSLYWRVALFDAADFEASAAAAATRRRWRRLETVLVWSLAGALAARFVLGRVSESVLAAEATVALAGGALLACWFGGRLAATDRRRALARTVALGAAGVAVAAIAWVETYGVLASWVVRLGHLGAVALWIGGAAWHNGVMLPTALSRPESKPTLRGQARRFRRHLAAVIPVVFLTGGYQTLRLAGGSIAALFSTAAGHVVALKLLVFGALTALVVVSVVKSG